MINTLLTSVALLAGASVVEAVGRAVVVNQCSFPVGMTNVPASGGGFNEIGPNQLAQGGSYSQTWTELSNGQGWSIKLYLGSNMASLIQYEYTFHNDGTIWYDLSAVNGDPFNGNWQLSADGGCDPRQAAYRYPTDDTYGMQSCSDSATITVTLCGAGGSAPAPAPSGAAPAPQQPAPSVAAPAPSAPAPPPSGAGRRPSPQESQPPPAPLVNSVPPASVPAVPAASQAFGPPADKIQNEGGFRQLQATPTTFDTRVAGATVTNVHTKVVTQFVTVSPSPVKRSEEHMHRHAARHERF